MISQTDKIKGGLFGLLVGDALGVPYEFHEAFEIPTYNEIEYDPPADFDRAHQNVKPGTWSDDGAQALALLESLLDKRKLDLFHFASNLVKWQTQGEWAVDRGVFDIGIQTSKALDNIRSGITPYESGPSTEWDNGNGSLMRVLPLALWHRGTDAELVSDAQLQSLPTHAHIRSQVCCALYCLWARRLLDSHPDPWGNATATLRTLFNRGSNEMSELELILDWENTNQCKGSGYVVDSLFSAKLANQEGSFEEVVKSAIQLGNDTDTTACITGGIAGIRYGFQAIPNRWTSNLRGQSILDPLSRKLAES